MPADKPILPSGPEFDSIDPSQPFVTGRPTIPVSHVDIPAYADSVNRPQLSTTTKTPNSRILNIKLTTKGPEKSRIICVGTDVSVIDLFTRVQRRMNRTLADQEVKALGLRLSKQSPEIEPLEVESDDADTWRIFLKHIAGVDGDEIDVVAEVEV